MKAKNRKKNVAISKKNWIKKYKMKKIKKMKKKKKIIEAKKK